MPSTDCSLENDILIHDRDPLYPGVSDHAWRRRDRIRETAAAIAEFECVCGAVRPHNQRELLRADDLFWRRRIAECDPRVRNALSLKSGITKDSIIVSSSQRRRRLQ